MADTGSSETDSDTIDVGATGTTDAVEWTAPTKDEWEKTQKALAKANSESKTRREELAAARKATEDDTGKAAREASEAAERKFKPVAVRAAAKSAFLEAGLQGVTPERVAKLVRMLDLDAIGIDDDGDVTGLEEQVKSVKADYPELFAAQDKKPPRISGSDRQSNGQQPKRSADLLAAQALGG
jgi:hypothetical protein